MKAGQIFEIFVKYILLQVGFVEVKSDGLYVFDGTSGQMIQGLGESHNADVLLEPPVQIPLFTQTRVLIECKDYEKKVGLNIIRSALGLREDINHFELVDKNELLSRKSQRRKGIIKTFERFSYQVAVASTNGFTVQAQKFAATHRIPLIEFDKMPFWEKYTDLLEQLEGENDDEVIIGRIVDLARDIGRRMAVAITSSGQMLFLFQERRISHEFSNDYSLYWISPTLPWKMVTGNQTYLFQLPENIMKQWLENVENSFDIRREAIRCKEIMLSNMVVYYMENERRCIKMISIDKERLEEVKTRLENRNE